MSYIHGCWITLKISAYFEEQLLQISNAFCPGPPPSCKTRQRSWRHACEPLKPDFELVVTLLLPSNILHSSQLKLANQRPFFNSLWLANWVLFGENIQNQESTYCSTLYLIRTYLCPHNCHSTIGRWYSCIYSKLKTLSTVIKMIILESK